MKFFVDGEEIEFAPQQVQIDQLPDRWVVKTPRGAETAAAVRQGDAVLISFRGRQFRLETRRPRGKGAATAQSGELRAPMPGQIVDVLSEPGARVSKGDKIVVLEAMKTQQAFTAPFDGVVARIDAEVGMQVADGDILAVVEPAD